MSRDAESHADEDKKRRELIDDRNEADSLVYQVEKMLKEAGDKMPEADKAPITAAVEKLKKAKDGDDLNAIKSAFGDLEQAAHAMAAAQARAQQGGGGPGPGPQEGGQTPPTARRTATTSSMRSLR